MKQTYVTTVGTFLLGLTLNSCIQEEAPNAEADITACSLLPVDCLASNTIEVGLPYSDELNAYPIEIKVKEGTDLSSLAPTFELTPGATISPESGSIHDFSSPVRYTVTSEDRQWHRTYSVSVTEQTSTNIPTVYHFENIKTSGNYYVFYEQQGEHSLTWASGNGVLLHSSKSFFKSPRRANIHRHLPASLLYNSFFRSYSSSGSTTTPSFLRPSIFTVSGRSKCTQRRNFVSSTAGMEFSNS